MVFDPEHLKTTGTLAPGPVCLSFQRASGGEFRRFVTVPRPLDRYKGYDNPTGRTATIEAHYVPHIRRIGEEKLDGKNRKRHPARRWVVERTLGWMSKCRAILIRYAKKSCNYLGLIQLCCGLLWYRRQHRLNLLR